MSTKERDTQTTQPRIDVAEGRAVLSGDMLISTIAQLPREVSGAKSVDVERVHRMDTAGAWFVLDFAGHGGAPDSPLSISGASDVQMQLMDTVRDNLPPEDGAPDGRRSLADRIEDIGRKSASVWQTVVEITGFLGQVIAAMGSLVIHPRRLRLTSLVHHMQEVGLHAVPIVQGNRT